MADDDLKTKRGRGKGKRPAMAHINMRLPTDVLDHFRTYPNIGGKIRQVLTEYVRREEVRTIIDKS